jgi:hypothetical protein
MMKVKSLALLKQLKQMGNSVFWLYFMSRRMSNGFGHAQPNTQINAVRCKLQIVFISVDPNRDWEGFRILLKNLILNL